MNRFIQILLILFLTNQLSFAQCSDELIDIGKTKIGDATYIGNYKVVLEKSKKRNKAFVNYTVRLEKGNLYRIVTVNDIANESPLVTKLSDDYNVYGNSFDNINNIDKEGFDFLCKKTQNYYLSCFYKEGTEGCGAIILSIVKTYTKY